MGGVSLPRDGTTRLATGASYSVDLTQFGGGAGEDSAPPMWRMRGGRPGGPGGPGPGAAPMGAAPAAASSVTMYWLYQRPGGALLVLTLDGKGFVNAITLNGTLGFGSLRTSKGVTLGTDYMTIIRQYGYPDQSTTNGATLVLTYVDQGVRFQLDGMRVDQITIGSYVEAARANLPVPVAPPRGPPAPAWALTN